jgi:hypothetical protein
VSGSDLPYHVQKLAVAELNPAVYLVFLDDEFLNLGAREFLLLSHSKICQKPLAAGSASCDDELES